MDSNVAGDASAGEYATPPSPDFEAQFAARSPH
jgi:hypothetical protein